jgi:hypothetical protein
VRRARPNLVAGVLVGGAVLALMALVWVLVD